MKKLLFIFLFLPFFLSAQNNIIRFKLEDAQNKSSVGGANVHIHNEPALVTQSDSNGYFTIHFTHQDTIRISKPNYHPVLIHIEHSNFDPNHYVTINMVKHHPDSTAGDLKNLQSFEYHFVHDKVPDNYMKIKVMEPKDSYLQRQKQKTDFTVPVMKLDHVHLKHQVNRTHSYQLQK